MGSFADVGLAYLFSIALSGLITLTFVVAFVRLLWKKRILAQNQIKQDSEAAERVMRKTIIQEKILGEGDYFGVRAIERGYYGGVAQSPPPSNENSPRPSPISTIIDSNGSLISLTASPGSSIPEFSLSGPGASRAASSAKSVRTHASTKNLRLQPSNAELGGRRNRDPAVAVSAYAPLSPTSPPRPEASTKSKPNSESVSKASGPSSMRPTLNCQVQSYAQWRLSADMRRSTNAVPRFENKASGLRSQDISTNNSYTHPQTGRRRSRSAPTVEEISQLRSLQQELDAKKAAGSVDSLTKPSPSACNSSNDSTQHFSQRRSRSQDAECDHSHASTGATRSIRRTRDSLRLTKEFSAKPMTQKRQSRQLNRMYHDPSIYYRSDCGCSLGRIVELDKPLSSPSEGRGDRKRESSSSSSKSGSSTRSRSLSDAASASSIKSITESPNDISEPMSKESCKLYRRRSERERKTSAAIQPIATPSISR